MGVTAETVDAKKVRKRAEKKEKVKEGSSSKNKEERKEKKKSEKKTGEKKKKSSKSNEVSGKESPSISGLDTPSEEEVVVEVPLDFDMTDKSRMAMLVPNPDGSMKLVPFEEYKKDGYAQESDSVDTISEDEDGESLSF